MALRLPIGSSAFFLSALQGGETGPDAKRGGSGAATRSSGAQFSARATHGRVGILTALSFAEGGARSSRPAKRPDPERSRSCRRRVLRPLHAAPIAGRRGALRNYGPENAQVVELHDCFSANELITYEALGLCPIGKAGDLVNEGATTYGGRWVVNPSGGLISKGHPLGATGLAQCAELNWQLRGLAEKRQVKDAKVAIQHNIGLGGAAVVAVYKKPA